MGQGINFDDDDDFDDGYDGVAALLGVWIIVRQCFAPKF